VKYDLGQISKMLADRAEGVCQWLLPAGVRRGQEWVVGSVYGESGDSLRVNIGGKAGMWKDFASDEKGGDMLDLIGACRGVGKAEAVKAAKEFLGIASDRPEFSPKRREYKIPEPVKGAREAQSKLLEYFAGRGISEKTLRAYRVEETATEIVFPYYRDDKLLFYKIRDKGHKRFRVSADAEPCLFGWQALAHDKLRYIVLTEGEIDAMSFYEQGLPGLSVPFGGGAGGKQDNWLEGEFENLLLFDVIYLALDMDGQGQSATEHLIQRLGRHRCMRVDFGQHKDANEALQAGVSLWNCLCDAKHCDPPELHSATDYLEEVIALFAGREDTLGYTLPWKKTHDIIRLRQGEISLWAGINGHGKSQVLGHILVGSIPQGERWCVASMEFKPYKLLARMYRQASGESQPSEEQCREEICPFFDKNLYLFDVQGTAKTERILDVFEYAYRRYGCTSFLVDSLAKCGIGEDDYNGQKAFVDKLMEFSQRFNVHVHLVAHARKAKAETDAPDKMDVKGSGALTDMVDNVFIIFRNKKKERAIAEGTRKGNVLNGSDSFIECNKQRNGEWEGKVLLWFDRASLQYLEQEKYFPKKYIKPDNPW
jgi:twinkle protein